MNVFWREENIQTLQELVGILAPVSISGSEYFSSEVMLYSGDPRLSSTVVHSGFQWYGDKWSFDSGLL